MGAALALWLTLRYRGALARLSGQSLTTGPLVAGGALLGAAMVGLALFVSGGAPETSTTVVLTPEHAPEAAVAERRPARGVVSSPQPAGETLPGRTAVPEPVDASVRVAAMGMAEEPDALEALLLSLAVRPHVTPLDEPEVLSGVAAEPSDDLTAR